jgi:hypothetical protein
MITKILEEVFCQKKYIMFLGFLDREKIIETRHLESHSYASGRSGKNGFPDGGKGLLTRCFYNRGCGGTAGSGR